MNQRLYEIATKLGELYRDRTEAGIRISHLESDVANLRLALVPAEGWAGKNEEARRIERERAELASEGLQASLEDLNGWQDESARIQADIEILETERRALEWSIRAQLAEALSGKRNGGNGLDSAFEDAGDGAAIKQFEDDYIPSMPDFEDIPF